MDATFLGLCTVPGHHGSTRYVLRARLAPQRVVWITRAEACEHLIDVVKSLGEDLTFNDTEVREQMPYSLGL
jgi:thioredoxin-like negative regulator of GroEL